MKRILFLCTGNTCRSPVTEALARQMFGGLGLEFHSAGLDAQEGRPASVEAQAYGRSCGAEVAGHCSRPVSVARLEGTDWVIGMTRSHAAIFRCRHGVRFQGRIGLLGAPGVDLGGGGPSPVVEEVDDPYGGSEETYQEVGDKIQRLLVAWEPVFKDIAARK